MSASDGIASTSRRGNSLDADEVGGGAGRAVHPRHVSLEVLLPRVRRVAQRALVRPLAGVLALVALHRRLLRERAAAVRARNAVMDRRAVVAQLRRPAEASPADVADERMQRIELRDGTEGLAGQNAAPRHHLRII